MKPSPAEFDAIVVGSGPGGATVARDLAANGQKVLILEWGDHAPVKGTFAQAASWAFLPGKGMLLTGQALGMVRAITTGGSSLINCATAFDPPLAMLQRHGVDITNEVAQIRSEVPARPLTDELVSPAGRRFIHSAADLGYDCCKLDKFIFQEKCRPGCQRCLYGCPYGAKWSARHFVHDALESGACMINLARVEKVIVEGNRAAGVVYRRGRETLQAFAPRVIVSAGGIGSPVILRNSGIHGAGYDFFFDPLIFVYGRIAGVDSGRGLSMCYGVHLPDDGIVMTDFNLPRLLKLMFDLEIFRFGKVGAYADVVPIMIKVRDALGGRVINDRWVAKRLTREDKLKIEKGTGMARRILAHAGASEIYRSWYLAAHPGGTVKIGEHVNSDLETRIDNLYVCDCSVMPEEWGLPPTLTILGLARRLTNHILGIAPPVSAGDGHDDRPPAPGRSRADNFLKSNGAGDTPPAPPRKRVF